MKIEVNEKETNKEIKYPCLMTVEDTKMIVLFNKEREGTLLVAGSGSMVSIGEHYRLWNMNYFTPFNGTITLQND